MESPIVAERTAETPSWFWGAAGALAVAATVLVLLAEAPAPQGAGLGDRLLALHPAVGAIAAGLAVFATTLFVQRLAHGAWTPLLAGALVALDTGFLAPAHAGTGHVLVLALGVGALALFSIPAARWAGAVALAALAAVHPAALVWSLPALGFLVLRGNIYAAPAHLGTAVLQALLLPAALAAGSALYHALEETTPLACLEMPWLGSLALARLPELGGVVLLPNPATWIAGLLVLLVGSLVAFIHTGATFRLSRLPGRLQVRLPDAIPPFRARLLWLALFAATAPHPILWIPLFAAALAVGVGELGRDAPGFGIALALAALAFAASLLVRAWPLVTGEASAAEVESILELVPWAETRPC